MRAAIRRVIIVFALLSASFMPVSGSADETLDLLTTSLMECVRNYYPQGHLIIGSDWDYCTISRDSFFRASDAAPNEPGSQIYIVYVLSQAAHVLHDTGPEYQVRRDLIFCKDTYNPKGPRNGPYDRCSSYQGPTSAYHILDKSIRDLLPLLNY